MKRSWMIGLAMPALLAAGCVHETQTIVLSRLPASSPAGDLLIDAVDGHSRVQVFGCPVTILRLNVIHGEGIEVRILNQRREVVWQREWSEADDGATVDYSGASGGIYRITQCTTDYRTHDEYVGLIETNVKVGEDGKASMSDRIVLEGEEADPVQMMKLVEEGLSAIRNAKHDEDTEDRFVHVVTQLRNIGVNNPDLALQAMGKLAPKTDGHWSETLSGFRSEVEWIKRIRGK